MQFYWLIIGILAVWRLSSLFVSEAGPWEVFERMRRRLTEGGFGDWVNCFYCSSVWVSAAFAVILTETWKGRVLLWPALSAGAIIIEKALHREPILPAPQYYEDLETAHVLPQKQDTESLRS